MSHRGTPSPGLCSGGSSPGSNHSQNTVISTSPQERPPQSTSPNGHPIPIPSSQHLRMGTSPGEDIVSGSPGIPIPGSSLPYREGQASASFGSHGHSGGLSALRGLFGGHKQQEVKQPAIVTAEGSISQHAWHSIHKENSAQARLRTLMQLQDSPRVSRRSTTKPGIFGFLERMTNGRTSLMRHKSLQVSTLEGIYQETVDMLDDESTREPVMKAFIDLTKTQFPQLGLALRQTFFEKIKNLDVSDISVLWLTELTKNGAVILGFEKYMDYLVSDWLEETLGRPGYHPQSEKMLLMTHTLITHNAAFISLKSMTKIVRCICLRACRFNDPLAELCVKTLDFVMKYSELPEDELSSVITALCQLIADSATEECRSTAWQVARALLISTMGNRARKQLQTILERSSTIAKDNAETRDHLLKVLRGAIFCLANSNWGIHQIDSVRCSPACIIVSLHKAMKTDAIVCKDVLLSMRRLLAKYGRDLQQITWERVFNLFADAIKLCDRSPRYMAECNEPLQSLIDVCEELYVEGHLVNGADRLFYLVERSSESRAESSILNLIGYKLSYCMPQNPDWIMEMRKLVLTYISVSQKQNIRIKILEVLHNFYNRHRAIYEMEVIPRLMMPILHMTQREKDNKVQYQMLIILLEVAINVTMHNDMFEKILKLIHKLFNENITREEFAPVSTINTPVSRRNSGSRLSQLSTSTRDTTPSDIMSLVCNDNLEVVASHLSDILKERWAGLQASHITYVMDMMCEHLNRQYRAGLTGEEGGDVRVRVFASLLSFHGCPTTRRLRRHGLGEDKPEINPFAYADGEEVTIRPKYCGQFTWKEICKTTTLALTVDTWWSTIRVILQCLYRVLESAFLVKTAGDENVMALLDSLIGLHKRAQEGSIQVADNELARFLPPVFAVLLNYHLGNDRPKEMCRILIECVKAGSMEAVMACDVAIQIAPLSMAGFAHVLINNISCMHPSALRAIPTLELISDAATVPQFHTFFQEKQFHTVVDILMPYMNVNKFNTFIIACVHRILMRWFSTSPKQMRMDLWRYMDLKLQEAVASSKQTTMSRQPSGDGRHVPSLNYMNGGVPDTPPPMCTGGVQRTQEDVQEKLMDEVYHAMINFFELGSIPDKTIGMKEPKEDKFVEVDCNDFGIGDTIFTLRTLVERSKAWPPPPEEDDVFHDSKMSFGHSSNLDQRRRHRSALQQPRKSVQNKGPPPPMSRDDTAVMQKKNVKMLPLVSWTQLTVRHMYGKNQWMMRSLDELPDDFSITPGMPVSHQPLLLHLTSLNNAQRLGMKSKNKQMVSTRIRNLDRLPGIEMHAVGVLCIHPGQKEESEILGNNFGSDRYSMFICHLGKTISNADEPAGLQKDQHGDFTFSYVDATSKIIFLVSTLMPRHESDKNCNMKKRLIGNNFISVVWNESGLPFKLGQVCGSFAHVAIEVVPMDNDNLLIQVHAKQEVACWLAVRRCLVHQSNAMPIVRKLIIRAKLAVDVWRSLNDNPQEPYISSAVDRFRKIQQLKNT